MKTLLLMMCGAVLLSGCGQKAEIQRLEKRVSELEARHERLRTNFNGLLDEEIAFGKKKISDNAKFVVEWEALGAEARRERTSFFDSLPQVVEEQVAAEVKRSLDALRAQAGQRAPVAAARPAVAAQEPTRQGIPLSVYNQIAADVTKRYPADFSMQRILIDGQIEDYKKLHPR